MEPVRETMKHTRNTYAYMYIWPFLLLCVHRFMRLLNEVILFAFDLSWKTRECTSTSQLEQCVFNIVFTVRDLVSDVKHE